MSAKKDSPNARSRIISVITGTAGKPEAKSRINSDRVEDSPSKSELKRDSSFSLAPNLDQDPDRDSSFDGKKEEVLTAVREATSISVPSQGIGIKYIFDLLNIHYFLRNL